MSTFTKLQHHTTHSIGNFVDSEAAPLALISNLFTSKIVKKSKEKLLS